MAAIVVAGGGICGLASAMMLAGDGHDVTVLDRDPGPLPANVDDAWENWERRGVAQFRLGHIMLALGTTILRTELPDVIDTLEANGALRLNAVDGARAFLGGEREPGDDRFDMLTARRTTLEWVMGVCAERAARVTVRRGVVIDGLRTAATPAAPGVPHVNGVVLDGGEVVDADLVVDATGRRSPTLSWLDAIGARPPVEVSEDSGFMYAGRHFRDPSGSLPPLQAPVLLPCGSMSVLYLRGDNATWTVILYCSSSDAPLRRFREAEVYERVVRAIPSHAHLLDGEPMGDMGTMAGVVDRSRRFVVDGEPVVTGMLSVADAWACTNPSLGRGMSIGLLHCRLLRDVVRAGLGAADPRQLALDFDAVTRRDMEPWHDATRVLDRARLAEMRAMAEGRVLEPDPVAAIGKALAAAALVDLQCARWMAELQGCLSTGEEVFSRPGALDHVIAVASSATPPEFPYPDRARLLELVS